MVEPDGGAFAFGISDDAESGAREASLDDEGDNGGGINSSAGAKDFCGDMFT
jgi:hypothetical protein